MEGLERPDWFNRKGYGVGGKMSNDGLIWRLEKGKPDLDGADTYEVGFEAGVSFSIRQTQKTKAEMLRRLDEKSQMVASGLGGVGLMIDVKDVKQIVNDLMGGE